MPPMRSTAANRGSSGHANAPAHSTDTEVVGRRPSCLEELGQISGVGQAKLERYGPGLLECLQAFQAQALGSRQPS